MPSQDNIRRMTTLALLTAASVVLSWLDSLIPVSGFLPGAKLGLANLTVLTGLYVLGPGMGAALAALKILLSTFLFGNAFSFFYAASGGVLSFLVMLGLKKRCSVVFVSLMGGMFHNLGQLMVAAVILKTAGLMGYLPVLLLCGIGAGCGIGIAGGILIKRCGKVLHIPV